MDGDLEDDPASFWCKMPIFRGKLAVKLPGTTRLLGFNHPENQRKTTLQKTKGKTNRQAIEVGFIGNDEASKSPKTTN